MNKSIGHDISNDVVLTRLGDVVSRRESRLNLRVLQQLPSYKHVYNRYDLCEKPIHLPRTNGKVIKKIG